MPAVLENKVGVISERAENGYTNRTDSQFQIDALEYLGDLYNFAKCLTKNSSDADDLVQETYLRAFRFQHTFKPGTLRAWLFCIMRNNFFTSYRIRVRESPGENGVYDSAFSMFCDAPIYDTSNIELRIDLNRALHHIPEKLRDVLLAEVQGSPLEEIARKMQISYGNARSRAFRARKQMRHYLHDYAGA